MPKKSFYIKESELDGSQEVVINRKTDSNLVVEGCAGSGKSVLALWKTKQIQNENKGTYWFIVFTKALRQYMLDGIRSIGIDENRVITEGQWKHRGCPEADYIIVDEVQDFSLADIDLFTSKARKALLLYGDSAQQLYEFLTTRNPASLREIIYHTQFDTEKLVFNHRLPKKIARIAEYICQKPDQLERRCINEGIHKPKILHYKTFDEQLNSIARLIANNNMEEVGILFYTNAAVKYAYDYFRDNHDIQVEAKYDDKSNDNYQANVMNLDFTSDNPKLLTYHSAKGLQFENVFLPECTANDEVHRNALYVAMTRAYDGLYIMHAGNLSPFFKGLPAALFDTSLETNDMIQL